MERYSDLCQIWPVFVCLFNDNKMSLMLIIMRAVYHAVYVPKNLCCFYFVVLFQCPRNRDDCLCYIRRIWY